MARRAGRLSGFGWIGQVEVTEADALDAASVQRALAGVDVAYYLIHSLGSFPAFEATDALVREIPDRQLRRLAGGDAKAAEQAVNRARRPDQAD